MISADSHPVSGGFVFSYGSGAAPAATVDQLLAGENTGPVTRVAFALVRALEYGAIAVGIGALAVLLLAWLPGLRAAVDVSDGGRLDDWESASASFARRLRAVLVGAGVVGALAAAAALALQAATAAGTSVWSALGEVNAVFETRFGVIWGAAVIAWLLVVVLAAARPAAVPAMRPATVGAAGSALPGPGASIALLAVPLLALAFLPGLGGHAGVQAPVAVLLPANVVHVLAASAWIGGITVLVASLPAATRRLVPENRTRLLAAVMPRFSTLALAAVIALLAGGILQSLLDADALDDLLDTAFGRAILVKACLVLVLIARGRGAPPPHPSRARARGRRRHVARHGPACCSAGTCCAARWRSASRRSWRPARWRATRPRTRSRRGRTRPRRRSARRARSSPSSRPAPGPNEIHLYLFNRRDGRQYDAPKELRVEASLPERGIQPVKFPAEKGGPGHYVISGAALSPPGDWRLEVVARVSAFDELRTSFKVPIR